MFRYSWKSLYSYCKKDTETILEVLKSYSSGRVDFKTSNIIARLAKNPKPCYILDLDSLLNDKTATDEEKIIYLYVASKKNIVDYTLYGIDYLHISIASIEDRVLKQCSLFEIKGEYITFKY